MKDLSLFSRLFPKHIDNAFRGHPLAIWLLVSITMAELVIGGNSMINRRFVATSADGIPLDRYGGGGAQAVVSLFALLGLSRLLLGLQAAVILLRYRAMIPLMYLLLITRPVGGMILARVDPIVSSGAPAGDTVVLVLLVTLTVGFALSLLMRKRPIEQN